MNNITNIIGTVLVVGLLFALGIMMFDGIKSTQTVGTISYNVTDEILEDTADTSSVYGPLVWIAIVAVFLTMLALLIKSIRITL